MSLLSLPDDVLLIVLRLVGSQVEEPQCVCRRFRALCHRHATSARLTRSYDGPVDDVHVQRMARCATLRHVDASSVGMLREEQPWPLASLTQLTSLAVTAAHRARDIPPSLPELHIRTYPFPKDQIGWHRAVALLAALEDASCAVLFSYVHADPANANANANAFQDDRLEQLGKPWMRGRVFATELRCHMFDLQRVPSLAARARVLSATVDRARDLYRCSIPSLTRLRLVSERLASLARLETAALSQLSRLELTFGNITTLRHLHGLTALRELALGCCFVASLSLPRGLSQLTWLQVKRAPVLAQLGWRDARQLRRVTLFDVPRLNVERDLSCLRGRVYFRRTDGSKDSQPFPARLPANWRLIDIHVDPVVPPPMRLLVRDGETLARSGGSHDLARATSLFVSTSRLASLPGLERCGALERVCLQCCGSLTSLNALGDAPRLTRLVLRDLSVSLQSVSRCARLRELEVEGCVLAHVGSALSALSGLTWLALMGGRMHESDVAPGLPRTLRHLTLERLGGLATLEFASGASQLTALEMRLTSLTSLQGVPSMRALRKVSAYYMGFTSLAPFGELPHLTSLQFDCCSFEAGSRTFDGLEGASLLACLNIDGYETCPLRTLQPLAGLTSLRRLCCSCCEHLERMDGVQDLRQLSSLRLFDCCALTSLAALRGASQLTLLCLDDLRSLTGLADASRFDTVEHPFYADRRIVRLCGTNGEEKEDDWDDESESDSVSDSDWEAESEVADWPDGGYQYASSSSSASSSLEDTQDDEDDAVESRGSD